AGFRMRALCQRFSTPLSFSGTGAAESLRRRIARSLIVRRCLHHFRARCARRAIRTALERPGASPTFHSFLPVDSGNVLHLAAEKSCCLAWSHLRVPGSEEEASTTRCTSPGSRSPRPYSEDTHMNEQMQPGKRRWLQRIIQAYVRSRLRKNFADVRICGESTIKQELERGPVVLACNHVAWWDPLLLVQLDAFLGSDGYCLMDQESLRQLPFFRWVGALPIDRTSPTRAYRDIQMASSVLCQPRRVLAIFPQGEQRPAHLPLAFRPGVAALAAHSGAPVIPLAIQYTYLQSP